MAERKLNFNAPLISMRRVSGANASSSALKGKKIENSRPSDKHHIVGESKPDPDLEQVTEPVAVPFRWEKIPGMAKDIVKSEPRQRKGSSAVKKNKEKVPEHETLPKHETEAHSFHGQKIITASQYLEEKEEVNGKEESIVKDNNEDVYSDALETLSLAYSYSMKCSDNGLSSVNGHIKKPSGAFATDQETRDFMMNRFLPAAKAMALEPPQYSSRKQSFSGEQPRPITRVISSDKIHVLSRTESPVITRYVQQIEQEVSESECDDYSDSVTNISNKACGLLPRLCFKNALSIINPVSALKIRTSSPNCKRSFRQTIQKNFIESALKLKPSSRPQSPRLSSRPHSPRPQSPRLSEVENKLSCGSNRFIYASDRHSMSRTSSPLRRVGATSPYRNAAPPSPFRGSLPLGVPKEVDFPRANRPNFVYKGGSKSHELYPNSKRGAPAFSPANEKILYVDTIRPVEKPFTNVDSAREDFKRLLKSSEIGKVVAAESFFRNEKYLNVLGRERKTEHHVEAKDTYSEPKALVCVNASQEQSNDNGQVNTDPEVVKTISSVESPLPLLLPKKPSESWLRRTLPSMSNQNPLTNLYHRKSFSTKPHDPPAPKDITKWENIVKSSYLYQDHVRYSEELVSHATQRTKR